MRELVQRGVLTGERGGYVCRADVAEVNVPATVQAAIEARIDRLNSAAKRTVHAASVIGARFGAQLLAALEIDTALDELLAAELIDQVRFAPQRRVCVSSSADPRGGLRIAAEIRSRRVAPPAGRRNRIGQPGIGRRKCCADRRASARPPASCAPPMAGTCAPARGRPTVTSPRRGSVGSGPAKSPTRCLPTTPDRTAMRIAPRTVLCVTAWRARSRTAPAGFEEMRELCNAAGDKASLAIGMTGLAFELYALGARARRRGWHPNRWRCSTRSAIRP